MCTVAFPHSVWFRHSELWFHSAQGTKSSSWTCQWKEAVGPRGDFTVDPGSVGKKWVLNHQRFWFEHGYNQPEMNMMMMVVVVVMMISLSLSLSLYIYVYMYYVYIYIYIYVCVYACMYVCMGIDYVIIYIYICL